MTHKTLPLSVDARYYRDLLKLVKKHPHRIVFECQMFGVPRSYTTHTMLDYMEWHYPMVVAEYEAYLLKRKLLLLLKHINSPDID